MRLRMLHWLRSIDVSVVTTLVVLFVMSPVPSHADQSADYLDDALTRALKGAAAEQEAWVAEEKSTREVRRIEGDANRVALDETKKAIEGQLAERDAKDKAERKRREDAQQAEERRQQMAEAAARERRLDALERQRAAERAAGQNNANQIIMDAINRNAQGIADAYRTGQDAVAAANRERARIEANRAAEAQYQREQAARRERAEREGRARTEAARSGGEEARKTAERTGNASGGGQQVASNATVPSPAPRQAPTSATSAGQRMASNSGSSAEPAKTYRRVEALVYCTYKTDQRPADSDAEWICDGPTQRLQLKESLRKGLSFAGCGNANTTSRRQTMGKGDIFYCEKAIAPYDRDIASIYNVPATIRGHRHVYECRQTSDTCTRETAVKFIAGGGL